MLQTELLKTELKRNQKIKAVQYIAQNKILSLWKLVIQPIEKQLWNT